MMYYTGIFRLLRYIHRNEIVIARLHGVMDDRGHSLWKPLRPQLSPTKLEQYLRALSNRYTFISLSDAVEMLQGITPMEPLSMVLTFDDGYRNNFTHALPILRRYHAPATFFVPTGFLNNPRPFWFDRLDYALQHARVHGRAVKAGAFTAHLDGSGRDALRNSFLKFRRAAKEQHMSDLEFLRDMEQLATKLEAESGRTLSAIQNDDDWSAILTWAQAREAIDHGITLGSHTVDHIRLGLVTPDVARNQLATSKRDIEMHVGKPCLSICYPNGSFTDETVALAKECGYVCGLTTKEGLNAVSQDVMKLRRNNLPLDVSVAELFAIMCGFSHRLSCLKSWLRRWSRPSV